MKRLIAIALLLSACGGGGVAAAAERASTPSAPAGVNMVNLAGAHEGGTGVITFGVAFDPITLEIPRPLTRFKRSYPEIAWSAALTRGVDAAFLTWVVTSQSEAGVEEIIFSVDEPIDNSDVTILANSGDLALLVHNRAGAYVMRYIESREVLAEGTFTLVR